MNFRHGFSKGKGFGRGDDWFDWWGPKCHVNYHCHRHDKKPSIQVEKTADPKWVNEGSDDVITYTYKLTNTSKSAHDPLTVKWLVDDNGTPGDPSDDIKIVVNGVLQPGFTLVKTGGDQDNLLEKGETWTYTATISAENLNAGKLVNKVKVVANDDECDIAIDTDKAKVKVKDVDPSVNVDKTVSTDGETFADSVTIAAGTPTTVTYQYVVTNTSAAGAMDPLKLVSLVDDRGTTDTSDDVNLLQGFTFGSSYGLYYVGGDTDSDFLVDWNEQWIFAYETEITLTFEESLTNTVKVIARDDECNTVCATDTATVVGEGEPPQPGLDIVKTVSGITNPDESDGGDEVDAAGDVIHYTITVANTGNVTLTGVTVTDPLLGTLTGPSGDTDLDDNLDVGETWTYTGSYTVTQADIDNNGNYDDPEDEDEDNDGVIRNVATADSDQTGEDTDDATVPVVQSPGLNIVKTVSGITNPDESDGGDEVDEAGDVIHYTITVANTGNVTLTNVTVTDPLLGTLTGPSGDTDLDGNLDVGETWTYTGSYTVTQADIDNNGNYDDPEDEDEDNDGVIRNVATVDSDQTGSDTDDATVPVLGPQARFFVGSNLDDDADAPNVPTQYHTVNPAGNNIIGEIVGTGGNDILIGDPGAQPQILPGDSANIILVLDSSGSMNDNIGGQTRLDALKTSVKNLLDFLAGSGADAIRVHIVDFDTNATSLGTFDIVAGGTADNTAVSAAKAAVDSMTAGGFTNYEAGLQRVLDYLAPGGDDPLNVAGVKNHLLFVSDGEPNRVLQGDGTTVVEAVSTIGALRSLNGTYDPPGTASDDTDSEIEAILGADYKIDAVGIDVGIFTIDGSDDTNNDVNTLGGSGNDDDGVFLFSGSTTIALVSGWSSTSLASTSIVDANGGTGGIGVQGGASSSTLDAGEVLRFDFGPGTDYDGAGPYTTLGFNGPEVTSATFVMRSFGAGSHSINYQVFYTDSTSGPVTPFNFTGSTSPNLVINAPAGKSIDYIAFIGQAGNSGLVDLESVQSPDTPALLVLDDVEDGIIGPTGGGAATNATSPTDLNGLISTLGGSTVIPTAAGSDVIVGGAGHDIIFGDVPWTDALATAEGLSTLPGSGWLVFSMLETSPGNASSDPAGNGPDWTRADTITYIKANPAEIGQESGRSGGHDTIDGGAGNDLIFGQEGNDIIVGGLGDDTLVGGSGNDTLTGGSGNDIFRFNAPSEGIDDITDFVVADDKIQLDDAGFAGIGLPGTLGSGAFHIGSAATDAAHRIIYDSGTGALLYDPDGTGVAAAIQFAQLAASLSLINTNFEVI
ncbi:MAG TPA: VWA domain-containing protein [Xanthobacteraceae bacterium]|nr:VWA domain-containing protein [Xanthobacteraceae bacterium]